MFKKIYYNIKNFILLPRYLNQHIIEMNRIEDSIKYQMSYLDKVETNFNVVKGILDTQNKLMIEINDKLDEIKRSVK